LFLICKRENRPGFPYYVPMRAWAIGPGVKKYLRERRGEIFQGDIPCSTGERTLLNKSNQQKGFSRREKKRKAEQVRGK